MKKVILSLVFVLATGTSFMNASSSNVEFSPTTKEANENVEEFGCASKCVSTSKSQALVMTDDLSDDEKLVDNFMILYITCLDGMCGIN